jgi:hypothetical protein
MTDESELLRDLKNRAFKSWAGWFKGFGIFKEAFLFLKGSF